MQAEDEKNATKKKKKKKTKKTKKGQEATELPINLEICAGAGIKRPHSV